MKKAADQIRCRPEIFKETEQKYIHSHGKDQILFLPSSVILLSSDLQTHNIMKYRRKYQQNKIDRVSPGIKHKAGCQKEPIPPRGRQQVVYQQHCR